MWAIQPGAAQARRSLPSGVSYLLLDRFVTAEAGPVASPRACEPGPNTLAFTQTNGSFSISSGALNYPAPSPASWTATLFWAGTGIGRATGRALLATKTRTSIGSNSSIGWSRAQAAQGNGQIAHGEHGAGFLFENNLLATTTQLYIPAQNTTYDVAVVLRSTGAFYLINDGSWRLLYVGMLDSTATLYPYFATQNEAGTLDTLRVADLGGSWATDYGIATTWEAVSAANDVIATTADCLIEHTFTAQTGVTKNILVRRLDDNNCWVVRCDQGGSTITLFEKNAGVETSRGSVAFTWTNGASYRVLLTATGTTIRVFASAATATPGAAKIEYTSASFQQTQTGAKVDHAGTHFTAWPRTPTMPGV